MKMRKIVLILILFLLFYFNTISQQAEELYSPTFLTGSAGSVYVEPPVADIYNPAVSGAEQRTALDLNYIGLHGLDANNPGYGLALNLGATFPYPVGVWTISTHYISSPFSQPDLGTFWELDTSFAKDFFPNVLIGIGAQLILGGQQNVFDWGLAGSLGFVHIVNDLWIFKDFSWGFAMRGLGKGYDPTDNYWLLPRPFTPAVGVNFKLIKSNIFTTTITADLSAPSFQNLLFDIGTELIFFDMIYLRGAYKLDLQDIYNTNTDRIPLTFGIAAKFNISVKENIDFLDISKKGWNQSDLKINLAALPLHNGVWGIGGGVNLSLGQIDKTPPVIKINTPNAESGEPVYVSPNNDGTQDDLVLPIKITDQRYVEGYKLVITDKDNNPVREIANKEERPENLSFDNVIARLAYEKKGITIPESVRWDGKSDKGTIVTDDEYFYYIEAWDDNGNTAKTQAQKVVVDNTPPQATIASSELLFSPNNDGNKDVLDIKQEGSVEDVWQGVVKNTKGDEVKHIEWKTAAPVEFSWDGKNDEGILVPDGVYVYVVKAKDRAGNTQSFQIDNIIINTEATPININIGLSNFSPNGDGVKDILRFNLDIPVTNGIEKWNLDVVNKQDAILKTFTGTDTIPGYIDFDGKDNNGKVLAEGIYSGKLKLLYKSGNNPAAVSPEFEVDLTAPTAVVKANLTVFSPNNDGNKDSVIITQNSSEEVSWSGAIKNNANQTVKSYSWKGIVDSQLEWDGTDDKGKLLPDDYYTYSIQSMDLAGNTGSSSVLTFQLNTEETPVILSVNTRYFSPNRDGVMDDVKLTPHIKVTTGIETYEMNIKTKNNIIVKTYSGKSNIPEEFTWDGTDMNKKNVSDGEYYAELKMLYKNGNEPVTKTNPFVIDTQYPEIQISGNTKLFSPDDDGRLDTVEIEQTSSTEDLWDGEILDKSNAVVRAFYWKGEAKKFEWNGRDENGNLMDNGYYKYRVMSTDKAGNKTEKTIDNIEIDNRVTPLFLTVQAAGFSPNNDGYLETISFKTYLTVPDRIKGWKFEIINKNSGVQKVFAGESKVSDQITWDGKKDNGEPADEGIYTARMTVEYFKGNMPSETTTEFRMDRTPPVLGLNIEPDFFSPDNDGLNDECLMKPTITDAGTVQQWKIEILDPTGKHFTSFMGKGIPSEKIIWDGISDKGELVQSAEDYKVEFTAVDDLGNTAKMNKIIPIDILVMKVGDRLKIRIASITFKADTADYVKVEDEKFKRNMKTIQRLAEIFKKYDKYNILIEGHAVSLYWNNPARAAKEQEEELIPLSKQRAEAIKKALVEFGLEANRITTEGIGGSQPVVPHGDIDNRWKNRRVEFILIRK